MRKGKVTVHIHRWENRANGMLSMRWWKISINDTTVKTQLKFTAILITARLRTSKTHFCHFAFASFYRGPLG